MTRTTIAKTCSEKDTDCTLQQGNHYFTYDHKQVADFSTAMLSPEYWEDNNAITGSAQGRGTTYFVSHNQCDWVLRHYYRGGLIGKFNNDSYLFTKLEHTRAAKEFALLKKLRALNLPAPHPVAYQVIKQGIFYRADLLSTRITNASDLVGILQERSLPDDVWRSIGQMILKFHQQGIYHHDLNCHNILIDNNYKPWLIDFDRGEQRTISTTWQQANLDRLLRSFRKEKAKLEKFHWDEKNWQALLSGYQSI